MSGPSCGGDGQGLKNFPFAEYSIEKAAPQEPLAYSLSGITASKIVGPFDLLASEVFDYDPVNHAFIVKQNAGGDYFCTIEARAFNYGGGSTENMQTFIGRVPNVITAATAATAGIDRICNIVDNFPTGSLDSDVEKSTLFVPGEIFHIFSLKGGNQPSNIRRVFDITATFVPRG